MYKLKDPNLGEVLFESWEALEHFVNSPALVYGQEFSDSSWEDLGEKITDHFHFGLDEQGRVLIRKVAAVPAWKRTATPDYFIDFGLGMDEVVEIWERGTLISNHL